MRRFYASFLIVSVLFACASPRAEADSIAAQPEVLRACVAAAGTTADTLQQCVGASARPCIVAEHGGVMAEVLCWSAEADTWREIIADATQQLQRLHPYRDPARLAAANAAWEEWAEAECNYWAWEEGGGSGEQVDRVRCHARVSADRAIALIGAQRRD